MTVTTFTYTHVVNKSTRISPTFLVPCLFILIRAIIILLYFSTLLKLELKLVNITTVGTDGEQAIEKALKAVFGEKMIHLWCFIHIKDNIRRKLSELLLPEKVREEIIRDIFGHQQGTVYVKGLVDAESPAD